MDLMHFIHPVSTPFEESGTAQRQELSCWDVRSYSPEMLRKRLPELLSELEKYDASHFSIMPWLRAIMIVLPQPSDELTLSVMDRGVVVLEAKRETQAAQVIEMFLHEAGYYNALPSAQTQSAHLNVRPQPGNPPPAAAQTDAIKDSEFSRTPAYFNQALYNEWLGRLSRPWRKEDAYDTEV